MRLPASVAIVFVACSWLYLGCGDASSRQDAAGGDGGAEASSSGSSGSSSGSSGSSSGGTPDGDAGGGSDTGAISDGAPDGKEGAAPDAGGDALPPGTVAATGLDDSMVKIANGGTDQCKTVGAHKYCGGSCDGTCAGTQVDSVYTVQTGNATPSLDGASTRVDVTNPGPDAGTDTLEWIKLDPAAMGKGAYADDTHFRWELDFYPTALDIQAYEFDLFFSSNGWWLMMGSQCDLVSGNWNGWNQATGHWIPSTIDGCGSFFQANQWNHIVMTFHRDPGPVTGATRYYYDSLEVNGVSHTWGLPGYTGTHHGWGDVVGVQVQQDLKASNTGTLNSYYDQFTLEVSP